MTAYTVKIGDTAFANVSPQGVGALAPAVMTYAVTGTALLATDTVAFRVPKLNGIAVKSVVPTVTGASTYVVPPIKNVAITVGTTYDTITLTIGSTIAVADVVGILALFGV